jgi:hypothetical protein
MLIYTASAGNQGTLGGLVEVTQRFGRILKSALERARLCSGDPVCADHDPAQGDRMLCSENETLLTRRLASIAPEASRSAFDRPPLKTTGFGAKRDRRF